MKLHKKSVFLLLFCVIAAVLCTRILLHTVFGVASVAGTSMDPTISEHDIVWFSRLERCGNGDIVIVANRDPTQYPETFLKRIIGCPEDILDIDDEGNVLRNGEKLDESYTWGVTDKKDAVDYPIKLQENEYFVMGDNREASYDSRDFGTVDNSCIIGKIINK